MDRLYPRLPFASDETPMSWAARQAALHTGGRVIPFLNDLQIPFGDLMLGKPAAVERLCFLAGQDPQPVAHNTIMALGDRRYSLRKVEFSAEFTTGTATRFCPLCLEADSAEWENPSVAVRHRLYWCLAPFRTCREHGVPLLEVRQGRWDDKLHELQALEGVAQAGVGALLSSDQRVPSPLQAYVEDRLEGASGPTWLDQQDIDQGCRAAEMLGGLAEFGPDQKAADMTSTMWDTAGRTGWTIVSDGEPAVRNFLHHALLSKLRANGYPSPRSNFGMVYGWLFTSRPSKDPGPIKEIMRDLVSEYVPLIPGQMLLGNPVTEPRLAYVSSIASVEGIHPKTLKNVLRAANVISDSGLGSGKGSIVADYTKARTLIDATRYAVPGTRVPSLLGASRPVVKTLVDAGHLVRIQQTDIVGSKAGKAIDGRSITRVLQFLKTSFETIDECLEDHVELAKAAEKTRVPVHIILTLLFDRHLHSARLLKGGVGFEALRVSPAEIKHLIAYPPDDASESVRFFL